MTQKEFLGHGDETGRSPGNRTSRHDTSDGPRDRRETPIPGY